jgi:two-component system response regulator YesN
MEKYTVVVADDEPAATKAICKILEKHCPEFEIVGTGTNGMDTLDAITQTHPDLVITDIDMPVKNGLTIAQEVHETMPDVLFVIISGYQTFDYMQTAIREGVLDYLPKPIVPSQVTATMEKVEEKIRKSHYERRMRILRDICTDNKIDIEKEKKYLPNGKYYIAFIRINGLPKRFGNNGDGEIVSGENELYSVYGRDSSEQLFLIPDEMLRPQDLRPWLINRSGKEKPELSYTTLLYYGKSVKREELGDRIHHLYQALNAVSRIGVSQIFNLDVDHVDVTQIEPDVTEIVKVSKDLCYLLKSGKGEKAKAYLVKAMDQWAEEKQPQLVMEYAAKNILQNIAHETGENSIIDEMLIIEDIFNSASSMSGLEEGLFDLCTSYFHSEAESGKSTNNPEELFQMVCNYVEDNLETAPSLQNVADHFHISQTYLSKLLRTYRKTSYNQYLTNLRMERAVQLMKEDPHIFIKDVAAMVGYNDQFYFSRVFHSCIGKTPSEFLKDLQ